jgi:hypothetical protein
LIDLNGPRAEILRFRAGTLMDSGQLPRHRPRVVKAGLGRDVQCLLCRGRIPDSELRYLIERSMGVIRFHVDCYLVWESVSERE